MLELALTGESQRAIAETVFGDRRLLGRVERILRAERRRAQAPRDGEAPRRGTVPTAEELFARYLLDLDERMGRGERVGASEIAAIIRVETMLKNRRRYEQLRELTRDPRSHED